jgi:hypothetical protein
MIMTTDQSSSLPPFPVTELTIEQQFKMRQLEDGVEKASRDDLIIILLALQRQCFVLGNNVKNLLSQW